jgi:hypothetical protein
MNRATNLLLGAVSALAIAALPANFNTISIGDLGPAAAHAKGGGNGGGNGGANGGGNNGGGNGNGGGSGNGSAAEHGKSADTRGHTKSSHGSKSVSRSIGNIFGAVLGKERSRVKKSAASTAATRAKAAKSANKVPKMAMLPATAPLPGAKPKNFHAKLAGLNSLKRSYNAYLNTQSPRMAAISAFVMASANLDLAQENVVEAAGALAEAQASFAAAVEMTAVTPYDDAVGVYDNATVESLTERLADLNAATVAPEDLAAWEAEVSTLETLLDSAEADAVASAKSTLDEAELAANAAEVGTDDEALKAALLDAANENRLSEYGDDFVDDKMMSWAKDVLGVGDAYGKIDQVRESIEATD